MLSPLQNPKFIRTQTKWLSRVLNVHIEKKNYTVCGALGKVFFQNGNVFCFASVFQVELSGFFQVISLTSD